MVFSLPMPYPCPSVLSAVKKSLLMSSALATLSRIIFGEQHGRTECRLEIGRKRHIHVARCASNGSGGLLFGHREERSLGSKLILYF